jgi:phosphohistidine phosphatase
MKTLYLLRHASSWKDPGLDDLDRPLNKRGRETAKTMAAYLRRAKITPDVVPVLDGRPRQADVRTHCQGNKAAEDCFRKPDLWGCGTRTIELLRGLPESVESALMIGHNPGLHISLQQRVCKLSVPHESSCGSK